MILANRKSKCRRIPGVGVQRIRTHYIANCMIVHKKGFIRSLLTPIDDAATVSLCREHFIDHLAPPDTHPNKRWHGAIYGTP